MTPISQTISIELHPASELLDSGLFSVKQTPSVATATVLKVSEDIKRPPVNVGDTIAYLTGRAKKFGEEYFLNLEMVLAKL